MNYSPPSRCAVCGSEMNITRLTCKNCKTELTGTFSPCKYCTLSEKHKLFLDTFLKCRGNIKEVERSLSISYPTVKSLLDDLLTQLFPTEGTSAKEGVMTTSDILDMLEKNEISADEAARLIKEINE
ncbi:hypothetical protein SDC9_158317 [bioreactor metagenome]|uniref:DUF2089 domain-containing protein n=1 Tax=bioreactor metagenome TaxID=1076179 RepID=A0A645FCE9_9ZZZZ